MEFREYLGVLRKYWVSITLLAVLGVVAAIGYVYVTPRVYTSQSTLFLTVNGGSTMADYAQGANLASTQARGFAQLVTTPRVLDDVVKKLSLETTSMALAAHVSASIPTNTPMITVSARDGDAVTSARIAQQVAYSLITVIGELSPLGADGKPVVVANMVTPASVPTSPTSPRPVQSVALGLIAGLVIGVGLAVLRKALDVRLHQPKDVTDAVEYPVIASIPRDLGLVKDPVVMLSAPSSATGERYRQLRTNLRFFNLDTDSSWTFAVTSSIEGEGKTVTSINIAFALAESGDKVLLIDADLRRPKIAQYLQLEGSAGLTTVLLNRATFADVVQPLGMGCPDVLTSGDVPPNPAELIGARRMKQFLEMVSQEYQCVIIDAAPVLPVADTLGLLPHVRGTVVVAAAEKVTIPQLRTGLASIERAGAQVMGIVLNKVRRHKNGHEYYNYRYEPDRDTRRSEPKTPRRPKRAQFEGS